MANKKSKSKPKYFLTFTEEFWEVKKEYQDWRIGRVEVYDDESEYAIDELRFATPPTKEWFEFREKWDFKETEKLDEFKKKLKKFCVSPKNSKG
jgi:hypothetical protein